MADNNGSVYDDPETRQKVHDLLDPLIEDVDTFERKSTEAKMALGDAINDLQVEYGQIPLDLWEELSESTELGVSRLQKFARAAATWEPSEREDRPVDVYIAAATARRMDKGFVDDLLEQNPDITSTQVKQRIREHFKSTRRVTTIRSSMSFKDPSRNAPVILSVLGSYDILTGEFEMTFVDGPEHMVQVEDQYNDPNKVLGHVYAHEDMQ